jgi:D-arabinose 1-dehydrogenase-like Zn-dependent alcohol dehydrogenase
MTAYRVVEWQHPPELAEIPVPAVGPGQVLVEVAGCGLCHSAVQILRATTDARIVAVDTDPARRRPLAGQASSWSVHSAMRVRASGLVPSS